MTIKRIILSVCLIFCLALGADDCGYWGGKRVEMDSLYSSSYDWGTACVNERGVIELKGKEGETLRAIPQLPSSDGVTDRFDLQDSQGNPIGTGLGNESSWGNSYQLDIYKNDSLSPQIFRFDTQ